MIMPITNPKMVDDLLPLILATEDLTYSPHGYLNYIKKALETEYALLLVNINDDNVIDAMAFSETIISITDREAMLNFAFVDKDEKEVGEQMWNMILEWAKGMNCKRVCCITNKLKARAMIRKYGFNDNWAYLTKELGG